MSKVEALQFNIYKQFQREIYIFHGDIKDIFKPIPGGYVVTLADFELVIDCFDNQEARSFVQKKYKNVLHVGFSDQFTFAIEWAEHYKVPTDITTGFDICEMPGARSFVASVAALGSLVAQKWIDDRGKMEIIGGKYSHTLVK